MSFNLNLYDDSYDGEYELFRSTSEELINMYGVPIKYLITEKINQDHIFGEHSHIKIDNESVFNMFAMPSATDMWEGDSNIFSKFGLESLDVISIFISRTDFENIHPEITNREGKATVDNMPYGNLVVFNNNKIMEVTNVELASSEHGNNNVFTSDRDKNVYKLTLKSYLFNHDDTSKGTEITESDKFDYEEDFGNLSKIFDSEEENKENVKHRAEEIVMEDETIYPSKVKKKPVRIKTEEANPFGYLG
jgi:hypothetical protein